MTQACLFDGAALQPQRRWPFGVLEPMGYDLLMIDPPWHFDLRSALGEDKSPQAKYQTMSDDDIKALPIGALASRDALVWLWATWPKLPLAMACLDAWGLTYKTGGAWAKGRWGTGYLMRSVCEPFLIATAGEPRVHGASIPNLIEETRREHSRKPEQAYGFAERMMPDARRVELFSRTERPGWTVWGDEVGKFEAEA